MRKAREHVPRVLIILYLVVLVQVTRSTLDRTDYNNVNTCIMFLRDPKVELAPPAHVQEGIHEAPASKINPAKFQYFY